MKYVLGVDIGGTQLRCALINSAGEILAHGRTRSQADQGPTAVIGRVLDLIAQMQAQVPSDGHLLGIGVGAPGPLDPEQGIIFSAPNMPGWHAIPLRETLAQATGLPVWLDNDANAAALGEWRFGAGRHTHHLVYVTVSTGIGGGVIMADRLLHGRFGAATEVGSILLDPEHATRWEDLASGSALGRAAAAAMPMHPQSLLHTLATSATVTAAHVAQAANTGDALATQLMQREARLLGIGFASLLHLFSPELLLVGGSVILENPALLAAARSVAYAHALHDLYREVPILPASLGDEAGVIGAAALALERYSFSEAP
ncbi:transcriptional regulator protein [Oscillochloris trichoides DG-6]|uniref:Transcriptional regulator protein n=1 Tax=Oscillochloris trichoides DG-6 TaxID=765420 RepID=E1IG80_9CHLR|nr:ROK family protein [Oscillochloris trichoides]EFO79814.1 transcriptional regulator protein [Oscillochloris trichoides DG-6]